MDFIDFLLGKLRNSENNAELFKPMDT